MTRSINSREQLESYAEEVVRNNEQPYESPNKMVAHVCIQSLMRVGDEVAIMTNPEPYHTEMITPKDVLYHIPDEIRNDLESTEWRTAAVEAFKALLDDTEDRIGQIDQDPVTAEGDR